MRSCRILWRRGVVAGLSLAALCLTLCLSSRGADEPDDKSKPPARSGITLLACRQIALQQQPNIAAAQATLKAAMDRAHAVAELRTPTCLAPDLPVRRKQSALGVTINQAGLAQVEIETVYGVTYSYLAALYAAQQVRIANEEIRPRLQGLVTLVTDPAILKGRRDVVLAEHLNLVKSFMETLQGREEEATQGQKRALAALREAMGVDANCPIEMPQRALPCPRVEPQLSELVALSVARRPELIQANTLAEIICLEIDAQATSRRPNLRTFTSGSDIHAKAFVFGTAGGTDYKPTPLGPEMPASLAGSREARMEQARDYHQRALATAVKVRNLVALEAEDLYRRWLDRSKRAAALEVAFRESLIFSEKIKESFNPKMPSYPNIDEVINAGLITTRLQLEWKEAHYQSLLALAALERATAGGFSVDFDTAPDCPPQPAPLSDIKAPKEKP
jgi:outer membrane protein TolC